MTPAAQAFAEIYDAFASDFERTRVPRFRPFVKTLLQLYDTRPKSTVLDAGTGTGLAATLVAPRVGQSGRVIGVDVSEKQLEIARRKAKSFGFTQCGFCLGDIGALDLPDREFDLVICSFALHGVPAQLLTEFRRVLKPDGGVLLFQDWAPSRAAPEAAYDGLFRSKRVLQPDERLARFRAAREQHLRNWDPFRTPADYVRLLNEVGFPHAQGHIEVFLQHFENARAYVDWRRLETVHRAELDAMDTATREWLLQAAIDELKGFETEKGLDFDWAAIQMVARL